MPYEIVHSKPISDLSLNSIRADFHKGVDEVCDLIEKRFGPDAKPVLGNLGLVVEDFKGDHRGGTVGFTTPNVTARQLLDYVDSVRDELIESMSDLVEAIQGETSKGVEQTAAD